MNVLLLTQEYPPETGWGGIGTYTHNLAGALARAGHNVHVLSSAVPPATTTRLTRDGVQVHRIRRRKFEVPVLRRLWITFFPRTKHQWEYIFSVSREIEPIVERNDIQIIEAPEIWAEGLLYQFRRRVPIIVKLHTPLFLIRELDHLGDTLDRRGVEFVDWIWTRRADRLVSASQSLARIVAKRYRLDIREIPVVPVGVDTNMFHPTPVKRPQSPVILYVGRIEPRKGVFTLADAIPLVLANHPSARFVFVGADMPIGGRSYKEMLLEKLRINGVAESVELTGHAPAESILNLQNQASVSVFPSIWENCSVACLEAMACARPVIATNAGGFPEMIEPGVSGMIVPPGDHAALASAITQVLENERLALELGANARKRVEKCFSAEVIAGQSLNLYEETIQSWKRRRDGL